MKYLISMTSTLLGFLRGKVSDTDMREAKMFFSCMDFHVLTPGLVPYEATWLNEQLPHQHGGKGGDEGELPIEAVDVDRRAAVQRFIELVADADRERRVYWKCGNQPGRIATVGHNAPDTMIFWQDRWLRAGDFARDNPGLQPDGRYEFGD